jgi:hypothetical protein
VLTCLILILEIASLAVLVGARPTGVGIWCAIPFFITSILTILLSRLLSSHLSMHTQKSMRETWISFALAMKWNRSRVWSTRVLILQIVLLVFTFILIGIAGDYVSSKGYLFVDLDGSFTTKYQITQAQLAFGILQMFAGWSYLIMYGVVTFLAIWKPTNSLDLAHLFRE